MKRNRSPTSKFAAFRSPFEFRSFSDRAPFILRYGSVRVPFELRSGIEEQQEMYRLYSGTDTKKQRITKYKPTKRKPNQTVNFYHLNSNYYGKTYWNYFQTQRLCR